MHLPTSSAATPAVTVIAAVTTTVTTTVTTVVTTTAIAAAKCPPLYKDYSGSLWILFLGIVGSVIATYIADGRAGVGGGRSASARRGVRSLKPPGV
jgi:general stress protein CsbA